MVLMIDYSILDGGYDRGAEGNNKERNDVVINNVEITKICLGEFRIV
jgi:hypothetical protein